MSPHKINIFLQCPRRYKFQYIDRLGDMYGRPKPFYTMGDHVHATLKEFLSLVPVGERTEERIENILRRKWHRNRRGFKDREDERKWGEEALTQLRQFVHTQDVTITPFLIEDYHKIQLTTDIILLGKLDRVDKLQDGGLHIIDYKTKKGTIPEEIDRSQLLMYSLILSREQDMPVERASYLYLSAGKFQSITPNKPDLTLAQEMVINVAQKISNEKDYPATPRESCGWCDFITICPCKEYVISHYTTREEPDF